MSDIKWKDIESLIKALGGVVKERSGSRVLVEIGDVRQTFYRPHPSPNTKKAAVIVLQVAMNVTISLDLKPLGQWTDRAFVEVCRANPDLNFELTVDDILFIVPPVGGLMGRREANAIGQLANWNVEKD